MSIQCVWHLGQKPLPAKDSKPYNSSEGILKFLWQIFVVETGAK
jgi:hypothetical protein